MPVPTQYYYVLLSGHNPGIYEKLPVDLPCLPFCFVIQCGNFEEAEEVLLLRPLVLELQTAKSAGQQIESLSYFLPKLMKTLEPLPRNLDVVTALYDGGCRGIFLDRDALLFEDEGNMEIFDCFSSAFFAITASEFITLAGLPQVSAPINPSQLRGAIVDAGTSHHGALLQELRMIDEVVPNLLHSSDPRAIERAK